MLEVLKGFARERKLRVKRDEVVARLSAGIWKTCNRILEEVAAAREAEGKAPPVSRREAIWCYPKIDTRDALHGLYFRGVADIKLRSELTATEIAWSSRSDSCADDEEESFKKKYGYGELAFYRLTSSGVRKRKPQEDKLPEGVLEPVVISVRI